MKPLRCRTVVFLVAASCGFSSRLPPAAVAASPAELTLVDFENPQAVRLAPNRAAGSIVKSGDGSALEIATEAADFPSVRIEPAAGRWDITGNDFVAMDVRNPQDVPIRVLLSVNNPGADGNKHCNVASISLGAGESGVLSVTLGEWHGEAGHPLALANITSLDVLLDKPGRGHRFLVDNIRATKRERFDLQQALQDPFFRELRPPFGRGINLGNALDAPNEGEWGVTLEEWFFDEIKRAGFDSVRLPVRWSAHTEHAPPYKIDPQFLSRVDWAVEQALSRGLQVVLNVHHYVEMDERPDEHRARFIAIWEQLAAHYRDRPPTLAFELLNEPHDKLTAGKWNSILAETLAVVRRTNPTRTVVVGPVAWNGISELKSLVLPEADRNLVVTVHYYGPFAFTHQGADWLGKSAPPAGVPWTGTDEERQAIVRDFDTAAIWSLKHRRPLYLGEFGAYHKADLQSRARWTRFVADTAAERKLGRAYWEFCSGFGAYDKANRKWIEPLRAALISKTE
jgi:endoglucanase